MTRLIAGRAGGRRLRVPPAGTRPTSDRVREALFNALVSRIDFEGLRVLDLYAGSGALGLEALSRGAGHVLLVESDSRAAAVVRQNIADVGLPGAVLANATVTKTLAAAPLEPYDLVLADPPYGLTDAVVDADLRALLRGWVADGSIVVLERSSRGPDTEWPQGYEPVRTRKYGETKLELAVVGSAPAATV
ncbi:16S rRNA (guanine(966)-N(2))-methyltransferase RsmD [Antrihabitans sp. YC2-6]|uniref:16S rRNA (guanine(966)-N(2))-methyltransferase RsmD n=1 Tax=Antrihabitans sp. YC2-6 TaxID=2799498 RepID=UPI0018F65B36|nr:16S rRNA (guanine(966)-N(2))-methyltransferase RsmD [Antrihabitans sp. YC2-6]MBJ8343367.1 16S rRNA (guanine(966)-N(2))-methyltransferase RsmD [Antrihabitans sp. YC2-6]